MVDSSNPYQASVAPAEPVPATDVRLVKAVVRLLLKWRRQAPSLVGVLLQWRGLPMVAILGALSVVSLKYVAMDEGALLIGGFYLGAATFMASHTRRVLRCWPIQRDLMDWAKVEALARELGIDDSQP